MKHKVVTAIRSRGQNVQSFIEKHKLSPAGFYGTVAGLRKDKKTMNALEQEELLSVLREEFPEKESAANGQ